MKRKMTKLFLLVLAVSLSGCFFEPREDPTRFYILNSCDCPVQSDSYNGVIQIVNVEMPSFLNKLQITTLAEDGSVNISEFNRWAEPLSFLIGRTIAKDLSNALPKSTVFFDTLYIAPKSIQICVVISDCIGRPKGDFTIRGHWFIDGGKFHPFEKNVSVGSGYQSYAEAISKCVCEVAKDMAKVISTKK